MLFTYLFLIFFYKAVLSFFYKTIFLSILFTLTSYWLYSIFLYLYNNSRSSSFTSAISRFWRRSLSLFWAIEVFLFGIYIYLFLNCPIETEWLAEQLQLFYSFDIFSKNWFKSNLLILTLFFSFNLVYMYKNTYSFFINISCVVSLICILQLFLEEFHQFFIFNNMYWCNYRTYTTLESSWEMVQQKTPSLVIYQYSFVLVFLKFWHSVFIYIFCFKDIYFFLLDFSNRPRTMKYSQTNVIVLWLFSFSPFIYFFKLYLNMFFSIPYFYFFTCINTHLFSIIF